MVAFAAERRSPIPSPLRTSAPSGPARTPGLVRQGSKSGRMEFGACAPRDNAMRRAQAGHSRRCFIARRFARQSRSGLGRRGSPMTTRPRGTSRRATPRRRADPGSRAALGLGDGHVAQRHPRRPSHRWASGAGCKPHTAAPPLWWAAPEAEICAIHTKPGIRVPPEIGAATRGGPSAVARRAPAAIPSSPEQRGAGHHRLVDATLLRSPRQGGGVLLGDRATLGRGVL